MTQRIGVAQGGGVDLRFEAFVVAAQRVDDLPDDLVFRTASQRHCRIGALGHEDRQDDVPVFLARGLAHDASDGLDDVGSTLAAAQVDDRVQSWHVDAFGQAARVRQDMARAVILREFGELVRAGQGVHAAVHMVHVERDVAGRVHERVALLLVLLAQCDSVRVDYVLEFRAELFRRLDARRERDRVAQQALRVAHVDLRMPADCFEAAHVGAVEQGLPDADELGLIVHLDFCGRTEVLLHSGGKHVLADVHDHDLVVGQDTLLHGLAEAERIAQATVRLLVIHAGDGDGAHHVGLPFRACVVDTRGRGHVHAFRGVDETVVVDLLERALAVDDAGSAMRLVAYDQVEVGQTELLGAGDHVDGLIGGEHHVQRIIAFVEA